MGNTGKPPGRRIEMQAEKPKRETRIGGRSPMLDMMMAQLATQVDDSILSSSPAIREIKHKEKQRG